MIRAAMKFQLAVITLVAALFSLACIDVTRLEVQTGGVTTGPDGLMLEVTISNVGDPQDIASIENGIVALDDQGNSWVPLDSCSSIVGQTAREGAPITGTLCFPFQREDDTGVVVDYISPSTRLVYIMLTDNLFVSDQSQYFIRPIGSDVPQEPSSATQPCETTASIDVTVWERKANGAIYLSTRAPGERWQTHQTPLDMSQESESGRFYQGSATTVSFPVTCEPE